MATGTGNLPYPGKSYTPFDILTAEELNEDVANIESLAIGTGIGDGAVTASKIDLTTFTDRQQSATSGSSSITSTQPNGKYLILSTQSATASVVALIAVGGTIVSAQSQSTAGSGVWNTATTFCFAQVNTGQVITGGDGNPARSSIVMIRVG